MQPLKQINIEKKAPFCGSDTHGTTGRRFLYFRQEGESVCRGIKSRNRPARVSYRQLLRLEDVSSALEPPEKPACTENSECVACHFPNPGFVCWRDRCMREKRTRIQFTNQLPCRSLRQNICITDQMKKQRNLEDDPRMKVNYPQSVPVPPARTEYTPQYA